MASSSHATGDHSAPRLTRGEFSRWSLLMYFQPKRASSLIQSPAATLVRRDAPGGGDETRLNRAAGPRGSSYSRLPEADAAGDDVRPSGAVEPPELEVTFPTNNFSVLEGETRDMVVRLNRPIDYYLDPGLAGPEEGVLPDLP